VSAEALPAPKATSTEATPDATATVRMVTPATGSVSDAPGRRGASEKAAVAGVVSTSRDWAMVA
jgi:hypothetical protein